MHMTWFSVDYLVLLIFLNFRKGLFLFMLIGEQKAKILFKVIE